MTTETLHAIAYYLTTVVAARRRMKHPPTLEISWPQGAVLINGKRCTTLGEVKAAVRP